MTAVNRIKEYISRIPSGQPFLSSTLRSFATTENIRQILNRLVKAGEITRVARGVFVKTQYSKLVGETLPSAVEVAGMLAKTTGEIIGIQGAEAARQLGLATQVPMRLVFYTNGNTRTLKIANRTVQLRHVNPSRLVAPGTMMGLVISALYYLGKENVTMKTIGIIKNRISAEEFENIFTLLGSMPSWMSNVFYRYKQGQGNES